MSRGTVERYKSKPDEKEVPIRVFEDERDKIHDLKRAKYHHTVPLTVKYLLKFYETLKQEHESVFADTDVKIKKQMLYEAKKRLTTVEKENIK